MLQELTGRLLIVDDLALAAPRIHVQHFVADVTHPLSRVMKVGLLHECDVQIACNTHTAHLVDYIMV